MRIVRRADEIPASLFQAVNPVYIMLLGLVFSAFVELSWRARAGTEHAAEVRLGALAAWAGFRRLLGRSAIGRPAGDGRRRLASVGLLDAHYRRTLPFPVGLAMITRLAPAVLVSTVMGAWFLPNAFALFLAAIIAQFTHVGESGAAAGGPVPRLPAKPCTPTPMFTA